MAPPYVFGLLLWPILASGPIALPRPDLVSGPSLNSVLAQRRSVREYAEAPLTLPEIGALLWAGQGITSPHGFRTAPSAGGLYPLTLYAAIRTAEALDCAVYRYEAREHALVTTHAPYVPLALWAAGLQQDPIRLAPAVIVVAGDVAKSATKYGERASRYMEIEAGHVAQNILLEATSLGLAAVPIGAFFEDHVKRALGIPEEPLLLIPVGRPAGDLGVRSPR